MRVPRLLLVLVLLLGACGGDPGTVAWRDLELTVPDGWTVFDQAEDRLSLANAPLGPDVPEQERPEGDVVAVFLTAEPGASPGDWRRFVEEADGELEVDEATEVGGVPATRLQFTLPGAEDGSSPATRELVVVVPAREVVVLAQPVPTPGDDDAPAVFDAALPTFDELLGSIRWGAPYEDPAAS